MAPADLSLLCQHCYEGNLEEVKTFVEHDPLLVKKQDDDGRTPLHWAMSGSQLEIARYLLKHGADIDQVDESAWTCAMIAASIGQDALLELCLEAGADIHKRNDTGQTALHYAASRNRQECSKRLLEHDARTNAKDHYHRTPLHRAAIGGHLLIAKWLLEADSHVNAIDSFGSTPLHLALEEGHTEFSRVLIQDYRADSSIRNKEDKTPLDVLGDESLRDSFLRQLNSS